MLRLNNEKFKPNDKLKPLETHQTATGFVFNEDMTKVLLIHHKKLNKWLGPGGHVDQDEMPHMAVAREIQEEVGLEVEFLKHPQISPNLNEDTEWLVPTPYVTMLQYIPQNKDQPEHYHYDFSYLMVAIELGLSANVTELKGVGWFTLEEVKKLDTFNIVQSICNELMQE